MDAWTEYNLGLMGVATGSGMNQVGYSERPSANRYSPPVGTAPTPEPVYTPTTLIGTGPEVRGVVATGPRPAPRPTMHQGACAFAEDWTQWWMSPFTAVGARAPRVLRWAAKLLMLAACFTLAIASGAPVWAALLAGGAGLFGFQLIGGAVWLASALTLYVLYFVGLSVLGLALIATGLGVVLGLLYAASVLLG